MRVLFDHGTPRGIARALPEHTVLTAYAQGWDQLHNGALLHAAEEAAIDVVLTTDQGIRYQQNLAGLSIARVVLTGTTKWTRVRLYLDRISVAMNTATPGSYTEVHIPFVDPGEKTGFVPLTRRVQTGESRKGRWLSSLCAVRT